ncbi:MAG: glycosyltransferase family 4 protein [Candidatus Bathyarchaeota archaeon]|jgi:glycosyltransferase involved in cell wall biosynthesis
MLEKIKLAFLADGESVHTKRWLTYFVDKGYDVNLITSTAKRARTIKGVKTHELRFSLARDTYYRAHAAFPLRVWKIRKTVKKIDPDVLHAHYITNYGVCAALSGFHPLVLTPWGSDITTDPERSRLRKFLIKYAFERADLVHINTQVGRNRLIELGCDPRKIFMQRWGVDTIRFSPKARSLSLRRSLGIDNAYSVLCARYWRPLYNVEVFIKAVPLVLKKIENVKFIMLGGGPLEPKLKLLARSLEVYENIIFIGRVPEAEMPAYLASVDVYVDPISDYRPDMPGNVVVARGGGGIGQTTRQTMSCGTPYLLSDTINKSSVDHFHGLFYKQMDHRDLARKIIYILSNEKLRREIGEKSRKVALEIFEMNKIMKQWETVYHNLKDGYA